MNSEAEFEQQSGSSAAERHQILAKKIAAKLAAKGLNLPREAYVPVKSTFIDALPEYLPDEQPPITRAASAPMVIGLRPMLLSPEHLPREPRIPVPPPGLELVDISKESSKNEIGLCNMIPETLTKFPSIGARLHGTRQCKPCAWFHKPEGCHRKEQCRHCHACGPEELTKRKKEKVTVLKAQAKGEQMARKQQMLLLQANEMMSAACELSYQTRKPLPLALLVE